MTHVTARPETLMATVRPPELPLLLLGRQVNAQDGGCCLSIHPGTRRPGAEPQPTHDGDEREILLFKPAKIDQTL